MNFRYGISQLKSPQRQPTDPAITSFSELQDRAKQFFNDTTNNSSENVTQLLQLIEDFCREGDKLIEEEKQVKKDLQEQVRTYYYYFVGKEFVRLCSKVFVQFLSLCHQKLNE